jgi:hypothetical protein
LRESEYDDGVVTFRPSGSHSTFSHFEWRVTAPSRRRRQWEDAHAHGDADAALWTLALMIAFWMSLRRGATPLRVCSGTVREENWFQLIRFGLPWALIAIWWWP